MNSTLRKTGVAVVCAVLALPAIALGAHARSGAYTSAQADVHVAKGARKVKNADINCKLRNGVTTQSVDFNALIRIKASGAFTYHGTATYLTSTGTGYKSRQTTATLSGKFVTSRRVTGTVKGGPGACR